VIKKENGFFGGYYEDIGDTSSSIRLGDGFAEPWRTGSFGVTAPVFEESVVCARFEAVRPEIVVLYAHKDMSLGNSRKCASPAVRRHLPPDFLQPRLDSDGTCTSMRRFHRHGNDSAIPV